MWFLWWRESEFERNGKWSTAAAAFNKKEVLWLVLPHPVLPYRSFFSNTSKFKHTIGGTLRDRALAATTADANAVDDIALLGLVSEAAGLVGARRARGAVNNIQLTVLYYALSAKVQRVYSTDRADKNSNLSFSCSLIQAEVDVY